MSLQAKAYVGFVVAAGLLVFGHGVAHWQSQDLVRLVCFSAIALLGATFKVHLPAITGTMSVNFLFILIGIMDFRLAETLVVGCAATMVQCLWHSKNRVKTIQLLFNFSSIAMAIAASDLVYHSAILDAIRISAPVRLGVAAITFFLLNTWPVSVIVAMTEHKKMVTVWRNCYFWSFPYYLIGASIAACISWLAGQFGWQVMLLVAPAIYVIYHSYKLYLGRLEAETSHARQVADLHLRTIEALALAIDAKDHTTHDHLRRVEVYAVELAKDLQLSEQEIEAVRAASLLHDIGKLAVPEHIISKPGKLTPEEFEKMKIHPGVGAEILERVKFPYPVVPIVRAHHEKWNGKGYPAGLKGEEIPIGARILSVVDCLDALASDRQYRPALPLDEALQAVISESGKSFDPRVVGILQVRYRELERISQDRSRELQQLQVAECVGAGRGAAPAAGFEGGEESLPSSAAGPQVDFLSSIGAARQEVQTLFELSQDLGNSLSLSETLSVMGVRLKRMIPFDTMAVLVVRDGELVPEYVAGENHRFFSSLEIPIGEGLSGWVAENRKPILNGNPSLESGYLKDSSRTCTLRSALAVPLEGSNGVLGVLALYHLGKDAFSRDHLRILQAVSPKLALSIENTLKFHQAETSATTDYLTGLSNSRSLFVQLDGELARTRRNGTSITVLMCDLDGFKEVNDRFGHLAGDQVLRMFASGLRECVREYDHVARMGGDEFVLIMPGLKPELVQRKIQQIGEIARGAGLQVCGEDTVGLSVGVASAPTDGTAAEDLLAQADRRMYRIKQEHRVQRQSRALASVAALQSDRLFVH
jgi:diguanylate cyclase (GGDEF)-like protein/putative nucleotidyltransferase with HDIG domain